MEQRKSKNITTITLLPEDAKQFREAIDYYHFPNMSAFFRICGEILCDHYNQHDQITVPFRFETIKTSNKNPRK